MVTCEECRNRTCCKMVVVEIDTPETKEDYEDILWYLYHPGISVFFEEHEDNPDEVQWNLRFDSKCRYLGEDGKCSNYSERPPICRSYSTDECDHDFSEQKTYFPTVDEYKEWLKTCEGYKALCDKESKKELVKEQENKDKKK